MLLKILIRYKDAFPVTFQMDPCESTTNLFNFYFLNIPTYSSNQELHPDSMGLWV